MKKNVMFVSLLMAGVLLASCGKADPGPGTDMVPGTVESDVSQGVETGVGGSQEGGGEVPAEGQTGGNPGQGALDPEAEKSLAAQEAGEGAWEEGETRLSDKILENGDTLQVMDISNDNELYPGLEVTLKSAKLFDSPEAASLDRTQMLENTENYDMTGEPVWCSIEEGKLLVCDLAVKNLEEESDGDQHVGSLMIAYADPDTGKVSMVTCAPAYFPATASVLGASDYYHYRLAAGESRDMTVGWLIQGEYEIENLYLCVAYDAREQEERQYFQIAGQE